MTTDGKMLSEMPQEYLQTDSECLLPAKLLLKVKY